MIIKAGKLLTDTLNLGTPRGAVEPLLVSPGQSVEVNDQFVQEPAVQRAVARGEIVILNFCGFVLGEGVAKITVSATQPESPRTGDLWIDIS